LGDEGARSFVCDGLFDLDRLELAIPAQSHRGYSCSAAMGAFASNKEREAGRAFLARKVERRRLADE
jgi:hypothetical protein